VYSEQTSSKQTEEVHFSDKSINFYHGAWCHIPLLFIVTTTRATNATYFS
jgi:hypothetical protein